MSCRSRKFIDIRYSGSGFPDFPPLLVNESYNLVCHYQGFGVSWLPGCINPHDALVHGGYSDKLLAGKNNVSFAIKSREYTPNITLPGVNIHIAGDEGDKLQVR